MKKIVYVTGCLGFMGNHVTRHCLQRGWYVIGVDKMTYAANLNFLPEFENYKNFKFIHSDINDLDRLLDCDYFINTAAETHVDNSIISSDVFLQSNVNGVYHILELLRQKANYKMPVFLQFSTDEVYGDILTGSHTEEDLLKPSNPYAATKAAADMLILAWARTFNLRYIIVRPTNNYGIGQYVEKLIPKSCKYLATNRLIDVHDHGRPVRTWLHAEDTAKAILTIIDAQVSNQTYNIAGNVELQNIEVIKKIIKLYNDDGDYEKYLHHMIRVGQDQRYSIDDSKLKKLGWQPQADFDKELVKIVQYYKENFIW